MDNLAITPLHVVMFSAALGELAKPVAVHSLISSFQLIFYLPPLFLLL